VFLPEESKMPYEFNGEAYRKSSAHQKEWGKGIIAEFDFRGDEHILDLGCGDGALTAQLAEMVPGGFVLGIDSSRGMIDAAGTHRANNLEFRLQDIDRLEYGEEFDLVFSNATLHWVKDHAALLENCFRCLNKGGSLRFNFAGEGNCSHFFKVAKEALTLPEYANLFETFTWPWYMPGLEEYAALVKRSPFLEARVWGENADRYFPDKETILRWVDQPSLVPFLGHLPESARPGFRDYVAQHMIEETLQADGRCFETFRRVNLAARK
jgi:trans-aconitate 2-methyltransferase